MDDFLKGLQDQHTSEQGVAGVRAFAAQVAAYYGALCEHGLDECDALELTQTFQMTVLEASLLQHRAEGA